MSRESAPDAPVPGDGAVNSAVRNARAADALVLVSVGVRRPEPGVFVTREEPAEDLRANVTTLGWDVAGRERAGDDAFVDASPLMRSDGRMSVYDLSMLGAQIGHAVDRTGAQRLVLDSLNAVLGLGQPTSPASSCGPCGRAALDGPHGAAHRRDHGRPRLHPLAARDRGVRRRQRISATPRAAVGGILTGSVVNHATLPSSIDDVLPPPV